MRKRVLSLCLALALCLSLLPVPASATNTGKELQPPEVTIAAPPDSKQDIESVTSSEIATAKVLTDAPEKQMNVNPLTENDENAIAELTAAGDWSYSISNGVATISKYNGTASKVTIPTSATIDGSSYRLGTIDAKAFSDNQHIEEVVISEGITSIGNYAFKNCAALKTVTIPNSVTKLYNGVFRNCTNLESVTINGDLADFDGASKNGNGSYSNTRDYSVFYNTGTNANQFSVVFGDSVTRIPAYFLATGESKDGNVYAHVTSVTISKNIKEIGNYAFYNCYDLKSATMGADVTSIGTYVFANDTALEEVTLNDKLTTVNDSAFENCTALKAIVIPASVTSLHNRAFKNCTNLASVTINGNLADCDGASANSNDRYSATRDYSVFYNTGTIAIQKIFVNHTEL